MLQSELPELKRVISDLDDLEVEMSKRVPSPLASFSGEISNVEQQADVPKVCSRDLGEVHRKK